MPRLWGGGEVLGLQHQPNHQLPSCCTSPNSESGVVKPRWMRSRRSSEYHTLLYSTSPLNRQKLDSRSCSVEG